MKYLHLVWAALFRRKVRMVLTLLSIVIAFLLFGLLENVRSTFASFGQSTAGHDRLVTMEKRYRPLPIGLLPRIQAVPGVTGIEWGFAFTGTYQDPKNVVPIETHTRNYYTVYPELLVAPEVREAFHSKRTAALAGETLMRKYNWKIGDKIPLKTALKQKDGSDVWTLDLVGTYTFNEPGMKVWEGILYANWDYVDEARESGQGSVTWYSIKLASAEQADRVSREIDALSANSGHETKTQTENVFGATLIGQLGDLGLLLTSIMGAVLFTLLLLTGHTITQAVRERIPEMAVLKTIGFSGKRIMGLILSESVLLLLLGAVVGLALASTAIFVARANIGVIIPAEMPVPILPLSLEVWLRGISCAMLIGLVVGALPAMRGLRLRIVDALSFH